jgi:hypothetical protein
VSSRRSTESVGQDGHDAESAHRLKKPFFVLMALLATGAVVALLLVPSAGRLYGSRSLALGDCRTRKLTAVESCRGEDSSFQECHYYFRAVGTPDHAWCRALLAAADRPREPTACDFRSPSRWAEVECRRYGLARFDRCFLCFEGEMEASRAYAYAYDDLCNHGAEQVTCNVDPSEAGLLLAERPPREDPTSEPPRAP